MSANSNPLADAHERLQKVVDGFDPRPLPAQASALDVLELTEQLKAILIEASLLVTACAYHVEARVPGCDLKARHMGAILRDTASDYVTDPLEAAATLAAEEATIDDVPERDRTYLDAAE